nr:MAG TPA: hypothetical protein [Caudoviricetes sp.]
MGEPAINYDALIDAINKGYLDWDYVYKADWVQAKETQEALDYLKNNTVQLETTSGAQRAWVKNMQDVLNEADAIGDVANSNTVGATVNGSVSGVTNFAKDGAGKITSTTGVVSASTGLAAAGNFVFGTVLPAVGAVSAGCALGKTIDKALYNANPDFWDSHNMSTLNPETWNEVSRALAGTPGGFVFDMLFGTSPEGNTTQAYMDEQQLAYLAWYMQTKAVFNTGIEYPSYTAGQRAKYIGISFDDVEKVVVANSTPEDDTPPYSREMVDNLLNHFGIPYPNDLFKLLYFGTSGSGRPSLAEIDIYISDSHPSDGLVQFNSNNIPYIYYPHRIDKYSIRYNIAGTILYSHVTDSGMSAYLKPEIYNRGHVCEFSNFGDVLLPTAGVGNQPNATTPDLSTATSVATALELLKAQFPELWTNAVTNTVLQPDGALKTYTYVPVPTPEAATALDPQPVTGPATQTNPQVNPETAPSLKDLITKILPKLDPAENKPDIGAGSTPTVVPQTGKASSLYSVYNPTQAQLNQFGAWLWSSDFFEQIKKLFNDPMQAIIGLHKVFSPVQTSGQGTIKCGYLDSEVPSNLVSEQYVTVDCGSISLQEYFGNVFDYPPFTEISIYLPFIGVRRLDPSDVMRATVSVKYHVDVFTGACLADVNVKRDTAGGVLYTFPGSCSVQYPLSSGSYMGIVSTIASTVVGAITAPTPLGAGAAVLGGITNLAFNSHANVERSGSFTGNAGAMGAKIPYLIISRPQTAMAQNFETLSGYPSNTYTKLSACTGFTQVKFVHVENLNATDAEKQEIERLLKEGVIL